MTESDDNEMPVEAATDGEPMPSPTPSDTPPTPIDDVPAEEPETLPEPDPEISAEPVIEPALGAEPAPDALEGPSTDAVPDAPDAALVEAVHGGVTWLPFALYLALWVALAGLSAYFLRGATPEDPARFMPEYEPLLWTGVGLTAFGPVLTLVVWLVERARRAAAERRGLFASAMTRGALVTFFGVLLWLGTLFVLELLAAGWTL